eukprot:CAMPEP_0175585338 /NCGR_PEP_ID=MMETSP0096-20121207/49662_1 /TAXON_ID=311494 /ORGANISM="Alexandrium monilatum, Strain CCMP3105" /LENGTH=93 /DNA_ID=CAMNT_0016889161 /DNA_START=110 /DNA_END=387 /DNA_ORIENTATION=+
MHTLQQVLGIPHANTFKPSRLREIRCDPATCWSCKLGLVLGGLGQRATVHKALALLALAVARLGGAFCTDPEVADVHRQARGVLEVREVRVDG